MLSKQDLIQKPPSVRCTGSCNVQMPPGLPAAFVLFYSGSLSRLSLRRGYGVGEFLAGAELVQLATLPVWLLP